MSAGVDFRQRMPVVMDQGTRPSCLACAASDTHQFVHDNVDSLSAEALFHACFSRDPRSLTDGTTIDVMADALNDDGQPEASRWPYLREQPSPQLWSRPSSLGPLYKGMCRAIEPDFGSVRRQLSDAGPLVLCLQVRDSLLRCGSETRLISDCGGVVRGLHAVVAVGIDVGAADTILIRNSWGSGWGDDGHTVIGSAYLAANLVNAVAVELLEKSDG